jgi:transposase-like protein
MTFGEDEGCPACGGFEFIKLGSLGDREHFKCRGCGAMLSDTVLPEPEEGDDGA